MKTSKRTVHRSVAQAIRDASKAPTQIQRHSHWSSVISRKAGGEERSGWRHNLTTTTASGYTNAYDWLAKAMGQGPSFAGAFARQSPTGVSATGVSGATGYPTAGQGLAGSIAVLFGTTNASLVYGVIVSNTATALTVDQWYDATSTSGASGTLPTGGTFYCMILPGQNPAAWMAVTANSFSPATSDTTLAGELTSNGFTRAVGTYSHTAAASTYTLVHLWTATGTETINNEAQFGACNTTAGGVMPFESAEPSPPTLVSGDTLQNTVSVSI
jgi:hypothetical protein